MLNYLSDLIDVNKVDEEMFERFLEHINYYSTISYAKNIDNFTNNDIELKDYDTHISKSNNLDINEIQIGCAA